MDSLHNSTKTLTSNSFPPISKSSTIPSRHKDSNINFYSSTIDDLHDKKNLSLEGLSPYVPIQNSKLYRVVWMLLLKQLSVCDTSKAYSGLSLSLSRDGSIQPHMNFGILWQKDLDSILGFLTVVWWVINGAIDLKLIDLNMKKVAGNKRLLHFVVLLISISIKNVEILIEKGMHERKRSLM